MDNNRNLLLAVLLSGLLLLGWQFVMTTLYPDMNEPAPSDTQAAAATSGEGATPTSTTQSAGSTEVEATSAAPTGPVSLDKALASPDRVKIDAPRVSGSINLSNASIDDLVLKDHRETVDKDSGPVRLLSPAGTPGQYFAEFGFASGGKRLPTGKWTADAQTLTMDKPVTLTRKGAGDITYSIKFSIDENYMITAEQSANNGGEAAAIVQPFALIDRTDDNATVDEFLMHSGPVGTFGGDIDEDYSYEDLPQGSGNPYRPTGAINWLGFSDVYWLSALIPENNAGAPAFRKLSNGLYRADIQYDSVTVPAGEAVSQTTRLFAGAKESDVLDAYEDQLSIQQFGLAISWGWFWFLEKPLLWLLTTLFGLIGNFGLAIIGMTFVVRGVLFPIAQKQFASMAAMKAVQPKMKAIQERYKDDKQTQQQKIMELYKEEKVNPLAGCLPLLIQIPIFFALFKVLKLSIEMRHEGFIPGWINDLTAPDPWTFLNLFGLLNFNVAGTLFGIGVLAVLLGVTMWLTFKLNPTAMDPIQQQIFNFMPWVLMFVMAPFMSGLLLYWVTSNILTLAQQKYLYSRHPQLRAQADKDKADQAKKAELEKAKKGEA